jgi:hypothetical protein
VRCGHVRDVAVIDGLEEAALGLPAFEPRAAEMRDRHMRHVGEHLDAGHERAAKSEPARDRVVVNFVLGRGREVEGADGVGGKGLGHGVLGDHSRP